MTEADGQAAPAASGGGTARKLIRGTHRYSFRSGEWAELVGTMDDPETGRRCYAVMFGDGVADWWPVDDPDAGYEFRDGES